MNTIYTRTALLTAPRVLGFMDRDPSSSTFGCCERYFWRYKMHDYANSRFQEACHLLALLHSRPFEGNVYYANPQVLQWCLGAIGFWDGLRHKDGSVAENYPFDRSFCGTSFSGWAVAESLLMLASGPHGGEVRSWMNERGLPGSLVRTGKWLEKHASLEVSNQACAAVCALRNLGLLTGEAELSASAHALFLRLAETFAERGHLPEYGGFDLGYATIAGSCLLSYADTLEDPAEVLDLVRKVVKPAQGLVDPEGNYDPSNMSRGTAYLYPYAFTATSRGVLDRLAKGVEANRALSPLWLDDRYCIALATDYLKTGLRLEAAAPTQDSDRQP